MGEGFSLKRTGNYETKAGKNEKKEKEKKKTVGKNGESMTILQNIFHRNSVKMKQK